MLGLEQPDPELGFDIDLDLPTFSPECTETAPGAAVGGPGESPISKKLEKLTAEQFPDTSARPWIEGLPNETVPST